MLSFVVVVAVGVAEFLDHKTDPKTESWIVLSLTAIFLISDAFFWKAMDGVSDLPKSEALSADEAFLMANRVDALKQALRQRWFLLFGLKIVAGASGSYLFNQTSRSGLQHGLWLLGTGALVVSIPISLSFFSNWQQAEAIKTKVVLQGKIQKERQQSTDAISKEPQKPLKSDKMLDRYTVIVSPTKRKSSKR